MICVECEHRRADLGADERARSAAFLNLFVTGGGERGVKGGGRKQCI